MAQRVQGTEDLYGTYMRSWQRMLRVASDLFGTYGFDRIETPVLEQVATFVHGIGESTDVVRKEMFRVYSGALVESLLAAGTEDALRPRQRLALRPEGTAGVVRAAIEHNLVPQGSGPAKVWYGGSMFRGERPQKGRLRQFHQVGVEWLGADDPVADAECIIMLMRYFEALGLRRDQLRLSINSMGDASCRPAYRELVRQFIVSHEDELCQDCRERAELNPLRAFDCKQERCRAVMQDAPLLVDHLCEECAAHYAQVRRYLDGAGIDYVEDHTLVRGLDYYTRTVFEVDAIGAGVGAIGGGGRYDGLFELEGGRHTPGLGFAVGFERIHLALAELGVASADEVPGCIYVACTPDVREVAFATAQTLREAGLRVESDSQARSLKSQLKQADRLRATHCVILGGDEVAAGTATVRDMRSHEQLSVPSGELVAWLQAQLPDEG